MNPMRLIWLWMALQGLVLGACVGDATLPPQVIVISDDAGANASGDAKGGDAAQPVGQCASANDGVCDEPVSCAFGADEVDCGEACAAADPAPEHWGACEYRKRGGVPDWSHVDPDLKKRGSKGQGGPYGWWQDTLKAKAMDLKGDWWRHYAVYVPDSYDPMRPAPLIYYGAGFGGSLHGPWGWSNLLALGEREGAIIVQAEQPWHDMYPLDPPWWFGWLVYKQEYAGTWEQNPDVDFLVKLTAHLKTLYNVDRTRVYVTGHSRGAGMSIIHCFVRPDVFTGWVSQSGFVGVNKFTEFMKAYTGRKMPSVVVHGLLDDNVKPDEGKLTAKTLEDLGWKEADRLRAYFPPHQAHRWEPQLNADWWDFLYDNPIPLGEVVP